MALGQGFASAITIPHLAWALAGVTLGTAVGVLPGIGPALTVALLLPVTFNLEPTSAFIMFAGIYSGAMYGGSTTSILLNTPGETASIVTAIDGHMMARKGRGAAALTTAAIGSFVAGTLATIGLTFFAPMLASFALRFGPAEYLRLDGTRVHHRIGAARHGHRPGIVQPVPGSGTRPDWHRPAHRRGAFVVRHPPAARRHRCGDPGHRPVRGGRDPVPGVASRKGRGGGRGAARLHRDDREDWTRSWRPWLRGTASAFRSACCRPAAHRFRRFFRTMVEQRLARDPEEFGHGAIEGVAGPEAANNAAAAGTLRAAADAGPAPSPPRRSCSPRSSSTAFSRARCCLPVDAHLVWTLIASLYIGNVMLLVLNLPLRRRVGAVMLVPRRLLFSRYPGAGLARGLQRSTDRSSISSCCTSSGPSDPRCACTAFRSCRR